MWGGTTSVTSARPARPALAVIIRTSDGELWPRPLLHLSTPPPSPTSWLGANIAYLLLLSASLGRDLKMPFSSTSFCSIRLCRRANFFCLRQAKNIVPETVRDGALAAEIKIKPYTTFTYHFPIPLQNNQKKVKYRYDTGKYCTLNATRWPLNAYSRPQKA